MSNSGQVCISVERIYVEEPVHDEFVSRVRDKVEGLRQGPPGAPGTVDVGAIIFPPQIDLIDAHVRDAVDKGADVLVGGKRGEGPGRFYEPTVLTGVDHSMRCMTEETFGPTLPVMKVGDAEEALALANDGPYGLAASVWTRDTERGEALARRVEAGVCCVNDAQLNYAALELPMGGWKASGLGSRHGPDGIRKYTKRQSLLITPGYAPSREVHYFPYSAEVSTMLGEAMSALATSDLFDDAQRRTLLAFCDTIVPSLEPPADSNGAGDPTGFWARAASHIGVPEAVEIAILQSGAPTEQVDGLRSLLDSLAEKGMAPEAPQEQREALVNAFTDSGPDALAGITALRGLVLSIFYALPDAATGRNPSWDEFGYPGPQRIPPDEPKALEVRRPAAGEDVMTIEADVCIVGSGAGGGVVAGTLARRGKQVCVVEAGRLLQRGRLQPARDLGLPEPLPAGRAVPHRRGPGFDPGGLGARRRDAHQLAELPANDAVGARAVGERVRAGRRRRRAVRPLPRRAKGDGAMEVGELVSPAPEHGRVAPVQVPVRVDRGVARVRVLADDDVAPGVAHHLEPFGDRLRVSRRLDHDVGSAARRPRAHPGDAVGGIRAPASRSSSLVHAHFARGGETRAGAPIMRTRAAPARRAKTAALNPPDRCPARPRCRRARPARAPRRGARAEAAAAAHEGERVDAFGHGQQAHAGTDLDLLGPAPEHAVVRAGRDPVDAPVGDSAWPRGRRGSASRPRRCRTRRRT